MAVENSLNLAEDDIFKPYSLEEVIQKRLKDCTLNSDGTYSCEGNVDLSGLGLIVLSVKFKEVKGYFDCSNNYLTSLEGGPKEVGKCFWCNNNNLTALKGAPRKVGQDFNCMYNKLTSLEGAPEKVGREFSCSDNPISAYELKKNIKRSYLWNLL